MNEAAVIVVPLRMGGGTRLKVVESMSMSCAIVSTSQGAEGIDVVSGIHLELADDPQAFADAVVGLLNDRIRAAGLGSAARDLAQEKYSWTQAGKYLEELHQLVVGASPPPTSAQATPATLIENPAQ
jgi:glycosyltransferase involved in cell wall biosynthesis